MLTCSASPAPAASNWLKVYEIPDVSAAGKGQEHAKSSESVYTREKTSAHHGNSPTLEEEGKFHLLRNASGT